MNGVLYWNAGEPVFRDRDEMFMRAFALGCMPRWDSSALAWRCQCPDGAHGATFYHSVITRESLERARLQA